MGASDVQIQIIGQDMASAAFRQVDSAAQNTAKNLSTMGGAMSAVNNIFRNAAGVAAGIAGLNSLDAAFQSTLGSAWNFAKSMETNQVGMSGILMSMVDVGDRAMEWNEAMGLSSTIMRQLNDEALKTAATSEELVSTYRALLGPGLAAKMTIQEIVQLTSTGVNAVKSLGLNNTQLVQELRDLVQGGIQPASSTLATALGLKDKDIEAAKQSSEGLFKFLMDRLKGFQAASEYTQTTMAGRIDQIKEAIQRGGAEGIQPLYNVVKDELDALAQSMYNVNKETGEVTINPEFVASVRGVTETVLHLGQDIKEIAQVLGPVVVPAAQKLGAGIKFAADNALALSAAFGGWVALRQISGVYGDIVAVTHGATTAQTFLGKAVLDTQLQMQRQAAATAAVAKEQAALAAQASVVGASMETAAVAAAMGQKNVSAAILQTVEAKNMEVAATARTAEVIAAANTAAKLGQYQLAEAILATNLTYEEQSIIAAGLSERLVLAATAARAGQLELAQAILATNVALGEQAIQGVAAGNKSAAASAVATIEQRTLATAVMTTTAAHVESGAAAAAASATTVTASGVAMTAVKNLGSMVLALAGGWLGVAAATAFALYKLNEYFMAKEYGEKHSVKGSQGIFEYYTKDGQRYKLTERTDDNNFYNTGDRSSTKQSYVPLSTAENEVAEYYERYGVLPEYAGGPKQPTFNFTAPDFSQLGIKFPSMPDDKGKGAKKEEQAYEEKQRLNDKIADMLAKMDEKIAAETTSVFETNSKKLADEVANMKRELDKSKIDFAKYNIDVSGVQGKMQEYQATMTAKYAKEQMRALTEIRNQTAKIQAETLDDKRVAADAEYQITLSSLEKEREERLKKVPKSKEDTEGKDAVNAWYQQSIDAAAKKKVDAYREADLQVYENAIRHNSLLTTLEGKTQEEIDVLNHRELMAKVRYLDEELKKAQLTKEERIRLEQEKVNTIKSINDIATRNIATAGGEAIRQIKERTVDYAGIMVNTFDEVNRSAEENWTKMLSGQQGFAASMKNIWNDLTTSVLSMMAKMIYYQMVYKPMQSFFTNMLGNWFGGGGVTGYGSAAAGVQGPAMANGGFYSKPQFATGGNYRGGLALVGEEGPELINFDSPGYVYTANQTRNIMNGNQQPPKVEVNVINQSGKDVTVTRQETRFDGTATVVDLWLDGYARNVNGMRTILQGGGM